MTGHSMKRFQGMAMALLLVLAGCSATTTGTNTKAAGHFTIREGQMLRMGLGGSGEGTLVFRGWQHRFDVKNMVLDSIDLEEVELRLTGEVWNMKKLEDFPGTYHPVETETKEGKGLIGLWMKNEKGVKVLVHTAGKNLTVRLDSVGSVVTLK